MGIDVRTMYLYVSLCHMFLYADAAFAICFHMYTYDAMSIRVAAYGSFKTCIGSIIAYLCMYTPCIRIFQYIFFLYI